jgi:phosphohistidine phosphatase
MKTLYLLRHAKSDWDDPKLDDFDRPLSKRGQRAGQRMGRYFTENKIRPELVLCSPALRTRETWDWVAPAIHPPPTFKALQGLYLAPPSRILTILRRLPEECGAVLVIGHNPGIGRVATLLAREGRNLGRMREKYPTGALAVLTLDVDAWREIRGGRGRLMSFIAPADLERPLGQTG